MRFPGPANGKAVFHRIDREYVDLQKGPLLSVNHPFSILYLDT